MSKTALGVLVVLLASGGAVGSSEAKAPTTKDEAVVPEALRLWAPWVLDSDDAKDARCPSLGDTEGVCAWPARLALALDERGSTFSQQWQIFRPGLASLPGDKEHWPLGVRLDGRPAPVVDRGGDPQVHMPAGRHVVTGRFAWDSLPESIRVPIETGLVALTIAGKSAAFPMRDAEGRVFLGRKAEDSAEENTVDVSVHRKLTDDTPLGLTTRLTLAVSGKSRELLLGRSQPAGFEPLAVTSELPLRFDTDGRLRVQARPGTWTVEIRSRRVLRGPSITRPRPEGLWKEGDEAWVFEARPELRVVTVEGVPAIDPAQTTLPTPWKSLPAYALAPEATLILAEQRRGDALPAPDRLTLTRRYWLDFDGGGYSVRDEIAGQFSRAWRLEMGPGTKLGRVAVDGQDQFITRLGPQGRAGVEIRTGRAAIQADSRIEGRRGLVPATSFAHDFDGVGATLHIPAGWSLLHGSGADQVSGTWIERWSLLELFLLLVTALAVGRLYGWPSGLLAGAALVLTLVEPEAARLVWLFVLLAEVLVRALHPGVAHAFVRAFRVGIWLALISALVPFSVRQIRQGMHPAAGVSGNAPDRFIKFSIRPPDEAPAPAAAPGQPMGRVDEVEARSLAMAEEQQVMPKKEVRGVGRSRASQPRGPVRSRPYTDKAAWSQNIAEYDPSIVVQTGQGLPDWSWETATIAFNGPVGQGQSLRFYLVPPWLNAILSFLRVGLLAGLAWLLLRRPLRLRSAWIARRPLITGLVALSLVLPLSARAAEMPSQEILDELKARLLRAPSCKPACASINEMALDVSPTEVRLSLDVSAAARTAIALPGDASSWSPASVRVNGKAADALRRDEQGVLWLALDPGVFTVELRGPVPSRDTIQIPLPMPPRHATATSRGFSVAGIHEDGAVGESILLTREPRSKGTDETESSSTGPTLPPFLRVERTLVLGLKWEVHTRVARETAPGTPIVVEIPLLPGESVTTAGIRVEKARGTVSLSFAPGDTETLWQSTLAESAEIRFWADPAVASRWSETWRVEVGPTWHATFTGIPPVHRTEATSDRVPEWRPWPGEEVRISLEKPQGVAGQTLTIDKSNLVVEPGVRSSRLTLTLGLRSSRGTQHKVGLPPGAEVESIALDGVRQPIRQEGPSVVLTVPPGKRAFEIIWRQDAGLAPAFMVPAVDLGMPSTNSRVSVVLERAPRWLIWLSGPRTGPSVQVWSVAVILLLVGWGLARSRLTPLRTHDWFLLGLGLMPLDLGAALVLPLCLLALGFRSRRATELRPRAHDATQILLALLVLASLAVLVAAVERGLLQTPDMRVMGNGSSATELHWYQDRIASRLPQPWVLSLPLMVYRVAMLAWALWLAAACIRWARWVWRCFTEHGLWKPLRARITLPPAAP